MNIIGYYGLFAKLEEVHEKRVSNELDNGEYVGAEAITLRVPLATPYGTNTDTYERINGTFEYEGQMYQLFKQKLHNDTLYVICIKDVHATELKKSFEEFVASLTDNGSNADEGGKPSILPLRDFETSMTVFVNKSPFAICSGLFQYYFFSERINDNFPADQPPEV